ncbi:hypothetical protein [Gracilibacillus salinarum]|uniref:Uncharacterized protein n=1 Tax=Gracilibacillus salinarum TaxID=2932255 RepID=A0ABY4GRS0_9BACI|nr:hypothetical protein [Gracilibacillus salinarum]UOQ86979.1 hypothetical protein MUN87_08890 [Gracilibacillus salinarum]
MMNRINETVNERLLVEVKIIKNHHLRVVMVFLFVFLCLLLFSNALLFE